MKPSILIASLLALVMVGSFPPTARAETVTLSGRSVPNAATRTEIITLLTNDVAEVIYSYAVGTGVALIVELAEFGFSYGLMKSQPVQLPPPVVAGPAKLYVELPPTPTDSGGYYGICTVRITHSATAIPLASNVIVLPESTTGPARLFLESSSDLMTWTLTEPGVYGASTTKRFFRIRLER
jgi:hypothetical protein